MEAKKIKTTLKINKERNEKVNPEKLENNFKLILRDDSVFLKYGNTFSFDSISFLGYEKEINSNHETFLIKNNSEARIMAFKIKIIYKDLKDRMFHSRIIDNECDIPPKETRKIDINTWDKQKTYYYYLGNEPRKVATPYKVEFSLLSVAIED